MKIHNIGYLLKEGFKNLWKNRTMSIASIGVLISCLLLTGCAALVSVNLTSMMASVEGNNSITVYLTTGLPSLTAIEIGNEIRSIENVSDCTFIPKDDALANMMESLGDDGTILQGLEGDDNFLPDAYTISMYDLTIYDETMEQIQSIEGVDHYTDYADIASKLSSIDAVVRVASVVLIAVLGVVSLFIISNRARSDCGRRSMMFAVMMMETPLPMPCSVIRSPSQTRIIVPAVRIIMDMMMNPAPALETRGSAGAGSPRRVGLVMATAAIAPCTRQITMVR